LVLDTLLPARCLLCGLPSGATRLCDGCHRDLPFSGTQCRRCGLPLGTPEDSSCGRCIQNPPLFTRTVSPLQYLYPADHLVQVFKFNRQLAAGRILGHLLCETVVNQDIALPDTLIPVPLHPLRMARRGFNQAFELGNYVGKVVGVPLLATGLRRSRNTTAQSGLSRKQRRKNVRGAFYWTGRVTPGRHVALIDDVMTTGTTLTECARVIKKAGASRVDVWVPVRAVPPGHI
jgi:ComF family protein